MDILMTYWCILVVVASGTLALPVDPFAPPPAVCEYNGQQFQVGEKYNQGCDHKCVCTELDGYPMPKCSPMCELVDTQCKLIPNPNKNPEEGTDCCKIKDPSCKDCYLERPKNSGNIITIKAGEISTMEDEWCRCNADNTVTCGPLEL